MSTHTTYSLGKIWKDRNFQPEFDCSHKFMRSHSEAYFGFGIACNQAAACINDSVQASIVSKGARLLESSKDGTLYL